MKMKNIIRCAVALLALPVVSVFTACDDENYLKFDLAHSGIYFTKDTLNYSFGVTPVEVK